VPVKVLSVIGLLGSGKSSLIRLFLDELSRRGETGGVVVNDAGEVLLDVPEVTDRHQVRVIGGG
jgi:G3E family GTPase